MEQPRHRILAFARLRREPQSHRLASCPQNSGI